MHTEKNPDVVRMHQLLPPSKVAVQRIAVFLFFMQKICLVGGKKNGYMQSDEETKILLDINHEKNITSVLDGKYHSFFKDLQTDVPAKGCDKLLPLILASACFLSGLQPAFTVIWPLCKSFYSSFSLSFQKFT